MVGLLLIFCSEEYLRANKSGAGEEMFVYRCVASMKMMLESGFRLTPDLMGKKAG